MNLSASSLLAGLLISSLGAGIFLYGKSTSKLLPLVVGGAMCLYPFIITAPWLLWTITAALCVLLYVARERA
ncbi:MAG: amino acid transport protein [Phycisphaerae bacterium]